MNRILILVLFSIFIWQCQPSSNHGQNNTDKTANQSNTTSTSSESYPAVPYELIKKLWDNCDYIDYILYYSNFSMSQETQNSIRGTIQHISKDPAIIVPTCKAIGRIFFQIDGQNETEADIHLGEGCAYYVFYKNGQKTYANKMTEAGYKFYENIFAQQEGN